MRLHVEARTFTYHEGATTLDAAEVARWQQLSNNERDDYLDGLAHEIVYDGDHAGYTEIESLDWRVEEDENQ